MTAIRIGGLPGGRRGGLARPGSIARLLGLGALAGYVAVCAALWVFQRHLIFEPDRVMHSRASDYRFPVEDVVIPIPHPGPAAHTLRGWWIPSPRANAKTVLYLHGNDGNVSTSMAGIAPLQALGYSILLVDYRGYGRSDDEFPSEAGVYEDAQAAWNYLAHERRLNSADVFIYGHSLGAAIAVELALRHPDAAGLVVESGFTSIEDMAALENRYALVPIGPFLNQRFDSIDKVPALRLPVLYLHGTADEIVPYAMGERLYKASGGIKRFVAIESAHHEDNAVVGGARFRAAIESFVNDSSGAGRLAAASRR